MRSDTDMDKDIFKTVIFMPYVIFTTVFSFHSAYPFIRAGVKHS